MNHYHWKTFVASLLLLCISLPVTAQVNWPNAPAPCDDPQNLEACILAQPGEAVIEINANTINGGQSFSINKSVTLRPAPGFTPVFNDFQQWNFGNVPATGPEYVTVIIEDFTFRLFGLVVNQTDGNAALDLEFRNNRVEELAGSNLRILGNQEPSDEPMSFIFENNVIGSNLSGNNVSNSEILGIASSWSFGNRGVIRNNVFEVIDLIQTAVISISGPAGLFTELDVDVIGNRIQGSNINGGILFRSGSLGRVDARVINNVIANQVGSVSTTGALVIDALDTTGLGDLWLINNTLFDNDYGIRIFTGVASGIQTFIYNNIAAFSDIQNYFIEENSVISNDFNLGFAAGIADDFPTGPNFLNADPLFVSIDDPRLQTLSPAIDSGDSSQVPVDITLDIAANPRITGSSVDRGAYEFIQGDQTLPESVPVPSISTAGLIAMVLLLLSLGLYFRPTP